MQQTQGISDASETRWGAIGVLYPWLEWQRASLTAWLEAARAASVATPLAQLLHPPGELLARTVAAGAVNERSLETVVRLDAPFPVRSATIAVTPFVRLVRLRRPGPRRRRFVILAPHSGYATAVISQLVATLLTLGEVVVTDWVDARLAPPAAGQFGLIEQIAVGVEAAGATGRPAHLVSLSQSGPAGLAAAALLAARSPGLAPSSLVFLGCQLDPQVAPTPLQQVLAQWPRDVLAASLTSAVGAGYPGVGRRVYPALFQLLAYGMASPQLYAGVQHGLLGELVAGRAGEYGRQHADLHSLLDVPAELFLAMLDWALDASPWAEAGPMIGGTCYDLAPLREVPVLTLEAGRDELIGPGQTHGLTRRRSWARAMSVTVPEGVHHDLFTGSGFAAGVAPVLQHFYGELES
jgi:poly(3-hydroxybutyrate) depolymerase